MVMSTKFNHETCREVLERVDGTQNGIQAASARLVFWKRSASDVVRCWENTFAKADMEKRLVLIYLANDIAQTSRRSGREYIEAFHKALPEAFKHMMKHSDEKVQQKLKKLVRVWRDRNVWGNRALAIYNDMVKGVSEPVAQARQPSAEKASFEVSESLQKLCSLLRGAEQAQADVQDAVDSDTSVLALNDAEAPPTAAQKSELEASEDALKAVAAAHKKHQQTQESIVSELRRLADAHAAEMQTSARKLQEAQQRQQTIQTLLGRDDGGASMGRTLASAGVPATAPDLMSGSPRPAVSAAPSSEIMYTPSSHPGPASLNGGAADTIPMDPLSAPRPKSLRGDPRTAAAPSIPPQPPAAPTSTLPSDISSHPADSIDQLANMDPQESASVLAAIIAEAPQDVAMQFGAALAEHVCQPGEAV